MFDRAHHNLIASVLESLDAGLLLANECLFGGGTAIALGHGEYRESVDIDFVVSSKEGYRALRELVTGPGGMQALARRGAQLNALRETRADQYGLRTMLDAAGAAIKLEIIHEGRITLEAPGPADRICGVPVLTQLDLVTTKLLANSDRWADDAVQSRDLIDLAMLAPSRKLLTEAIAKASAAYGESIERDLAKAIEKLRARPGRLDECMRALQMNGVSKAALWKRIKALMAPRDRRPGRAK